MGVGKERPTKRRLRQPLSCQRCRKHRSKCSRERPSCEQCLSANVACEYLDAPGDLASTALRERFTNLEDQIDSLLNEFDLIEQLVYNQEPAIRTDALRSWNIRNTGHGVSIDTHMHHVEDIYATLIQFALDNATPTPSSSSSTNLCLTRNNQIYPTIKLSHFTSLLPAANSPPSPSLGSDQELLPKETVRCLLELYPTCLLHGSVQGFEPIRTKLLDRAAVASSPVLRLLLASCLCYMLLHACYWHPIAGVASTDDMVAMASSYYEEAKELVSSLYFEDEGASAILCHAICNLVLYHIESGNTSLIYLYSGMAARLAASLDGAQQTDMIIQPTYVQSIRWFMYSLDTSASHFHNKPYEVELEDGGPPTPSDANDGQRLFQWFEYRTCEITRDIRRTCFSKDRQHVPYKEIERIERKLLQFEILLHAHMDKSSVWHQRCAYMHAIRCHGHWILLHQTYLPTALSLERCSKAAFALVDLFDAWPMDCYFRPCIHELKQACEILEYLVANTPSEKKKALDALERLLKVILQTPVHDIARTRPFIQRIARLLES
ncbi:hypothetical protein BJV82DRAFT_644276 [Fennellomyces sp. T-0311]|nr:hypothetical protein BJV82DRAFT_644276 [Fennellomyces sp. T-0311]